MRQEERWITRYNEVKSRKILGVMPKLVKMVESEMEWM